MVGAGRSFVPPVAAPCAQATSVNAATSKPIVKSNAATGMHQSSHQPVPDTAAPRRSDGKKPTPRLIFGISSSSIPTKFLIEKMAHKRTPLPHCGILVLALAAVLSATPRQASAAPTAEVAKRCLHYAYIAYPFKMPGAAPASGAREAYFRDCLNKDGDVPEPTRPPKKP